MNKGKGNRSKFSSNFTIRDEMAMKPLEKMALNLYRNPKSIPGYLNNGRNPITIGHLTTMINEDREQRYLNSEEKLNLLKTLK